MIKFFRTIRHSLIKENKVSKYLLYAVGEIILVIIGILIALSINNKNEESKERLQEQKILSGIKTDFIETRSRLERTIKSQKNAIHHSADLIDIIGLQDKSVSNDSIAKCFGQGALSFYRAEPVTGTYDALIGAGNTSLIQNQDLLNALADFSALFKLGFEDETTCMNLVQLMHESSEGQFFPLMAGSSKEYLKLRYTPTKHETQNAIDHLLKNKEFVSLLTQRTTLEQDRLNRQRSLLAATNKILIPFEFDELQLSEEVLQKYVGDYDLKINQQTITFKIYIENESLFALPSGQKAYLLFCDKKDAFYLKDVYVQINFHNHEGKIVGFTLFQNDNEFEAKKVNDVLE